DFVERGLQLAMRHESSSRMAERWQLALLAVVFLAVQAAIWWPMLHGRIYAGQDLLQVHYPIRIGHQIALERGEPGYWFRYLHRGHSVLANGEEALFHPLRHLELRVIGAVKGLPLEIVL